MKDAWKTIFARLLALRPPQERLARPAWLLLGLLTGLLLAASVPLIAADNSSTKSASPGAKLREAFVEPLKSAASAAVQSATQAAANEALAAVAPAASAASPAASSAGGMQQGFEAALRAGLAAALRQAAGLPASAPASSGAPVKTTPAKATAPTAASAASAVAANAASTAPVAAGASAASQVLPPASAPLPHVPLPGAVACLRAPDASGDCPPSLQMVYREVNLPSGREAQAYRPRTMVLGGRQPFDYSLLGGELPEGMTLNPEGQLLGTPTRAGSYRFSLQISDSSSPPLRVRQPYVLRIDGPPRPRAPASAASAPLPPLQIPLDDADLQASQLAAGHFSSYVLLPEDLDKIPALSLEPPPAELPAAAGTSAQEIAPGVQIESAAPTQTPAAGLANASRLAPAAQLRDMLQPLIRIEFPTRVLYAAALQAARCNYFLLLAKQAALKQGRDGREITCPLDSTGPAGPATPGKSAVSPVSADAAPTLSLSELHDALLPEELLETLLNQARKPHSLAQAKPVPWQDADCPCVAAEIPELTYGIYPFWQADPATPQQVRFSVFKRIGFLGVQLGDDGRYLSPRPLAPEGTDFIRHARRYGTEVDLVIQRDQWATLLRANDKELQEFGERAARDAMPLIDLRSSNGYVRLREALLPFWGESSHLFDGATIFFDKIPPDALRRARFKVFYKAYVNEMIRAMQQSGRHYALNLVMSEEQVGTPGAYEFRQLMDFVYSSRSPEHPKVLNSEREKYHGSGDVQLSFLVLLPDPTSAHKKALRQRLDQTEEVQGHDRVALLSAIVPVVFHAGADPKAEAGSLDRNRLQLDLAYFKWQFGGVALWPLPLQGNPVGEAIGAELHTSFFSELQQPLQGLCSWVCPNRSELRLLALALVLIGAVSISLFLGSCRVRALGRPYIAFLWLGGIAAAAVYGALLSCDPQLGELRNGNKLLFILLGIAVLTGMYFSLKPKTPVP